MLHPSFTYSLVISQRAVWSKKNSIIIQWELSSAYVWVHATIFMLVHLLVHSQSYQSFSLLLIFVIVELIPFQHKPATVPRFDKTSLLPEPPTPDDIQLLTLSTDMTSAAMRTAMRHTLVIHHSYSNLQTSKRVPDWLNSQKLQVRHKPNSTSIFARCQSSLEGYGSFNIFCRGGGVLWFILTYKLIVQASALLDVKLKALRQSWVSTDQTSNLFYLIQCVTHLHMLAC